MTKNIETSVCKDEEQLVQSDLFYMCLSKVLETNDDYKESDRFIKNLRSFLKQESNLDIWTYNYVRRLFKDIKLLDNFKKLLNKIFFIADQELRKTQKKLFSRGSNRSEYIVTKESIVVKDSLEAEWNGLWNESREGFVPLQTLRDDVSKILCYYSVDLGYEQLHINNIIFYLDLRLSSWLVEHIFSSDLTEIISDFEVVDYGDYYHIVRLWVRQFLINKEGTLIKDVYIEPWRYETNLWATYMIRNKDWKYTYISLDHEKILCPYVFKIWPIQKIWDMFVFMAWNNVDNAIKYAYLQVDAWTDNIKIQFFDKLFKIEEFFDGIFGYFYSLDGIISIKNLNLSNNHAYPRFFNLINKASLLKINMTNTEQHNKLTYKHILNKEPSMEDILASIRRILSEEESDNTTSNRDVLNDDNFFWELINGDKLFIALIEWGIWFYSLKTWKELWKVAFIHRGYVELIDDVNTLIIIWENQNEELNKYSFKLAE